MARKNNTRSIRRIEETMLQRIDTRRKLEKKLGRTTVDQPSQGQGWTFTPYDNQRTR